MRNTVAEQFRRRPGVTLGCGAVVVAVFACAGCGESGTAAVAAAQRAPRTAPQPSEPASVTKTFTLEFEAGDDMLQRRPDGTFAISAFQVGFFDGSQLVRALEIPRAAAQFAGPRVTLQVPLIQLSPGSRPNVTVRIRGLSSGPLGPWSAPAGSVTLPVEARQARTRRAGGAQADPQGSGGTKAERPGRSVSLQQLNRSPALKEALASVLRGASEEETAAACTTVQDLAAAVVLSRKHNLPVAQLCGALREPGDCPVETLLKSTQPSIDAIAELKAARTEARTLVVRARGQKADPARGQKADPAPAAPGL